MFEVATRIHAICLYEQLENSMRAWALYIGPSGTSDPIALSSLQQSEAISYIRDNVLW